jgi:hypothetical protein
LSAACGVGIPDRRRRQQRALQRLGRGDVRPRVARAHRDPDTHGADADARATHRNAARQQILEAAGGSDDDVGGLALGGAPRDGAGRAVREAQAVTVLGAEPLGDGAQRCLHAARAQHGDLLGGGGGERGQRQGERDGAGSEAAHGQ